MYYYLIIGLQGFCLYHCYTHRNNYYWFLAIIFLPVVGSVLYLFMNVFQKRDVEKVQETLITAINPTKKIKDLEKRFKFSATFENQVALADAYLEEGMNREAIFNYEASLKDVFANDFYVLSKLVEANYYANDFKKAITEAAKIEKDFKFRKSKASFLFAMALEKEVELHRAEELLNTFDAPYSNFMERLELARFLIRNNKLTEGKAVYNEMLAEAENMSKSSSRANRGFIKKAREERNALQ